MSVNTAHTPDGRGVLLYQYEMIILYAPNVTAMFEANDHPAFERGRQVSGFIYLTSHRVIFIKKDTAPQGLRSFAMPFFCMRNVKLEQPIFGANYLKGTAIAQPNGNYDGDVVWKLTFPKGGCVEFGQALLRANDMAGQFMRFDAPPPYVPPSANYYEAPASNYHQANYPGFQNYTATFPAVPGNVFVSEQPPPYPGVNGYNAPSAPMPPMVPMGAAYPGPRGPAPSAPPSGPPPDYEAPPLPPKA